MPYTRYIHNTIECYTWHHITTRSYTKILDSKQVRRSPSNAENRPFCKQISKCLSHGKAPKHETDLFSHIRGLLYKHITDSGQKFLALVIPKSWKYTVLIEAHDKLGHQRNTQIYCLIKWQYYWRAWTKTFRNI